MAQLHQTMPLGPAEVPEKINDLVTRVLADNASIMTGPGTNSYIIQSTNAAVLIDPGPTLTQHKETLLKTLKKLENKKVTILLTHTHMDHAPLGIELSNEFGWPLGLYDPHPNYKYAIAVYDGMELDFDNFLIQALHTPGHTENHMCYLLKPLKILFAGDHILGQSTTVILPPEGSMANYLNSLRKIKQLIEKDEIKLIMPGHGGSPINPLEFVDTILLLRLQREQKVIKALETLKSATIKELLPLAYDDTDPSLFPVAKYSLWAHLIKLKQENKVFSDTEDIDSIWRTFSSK